MLPPGSWLIRVVLALIVGGCLGLGSGAAVSPAAGSTSPGQALLSPNGETLPRPDLHQSDGLDPLVEEFFPASGGHPSNVIEVRNTKDYRLRVRGRIQVNRLRGQDAKPVNRAHAYASGTGNQTLAVALQINLVRRGAPTVAPQNVATSVNFQCTGCRTVARAFQYVIPTDDPNRVPDDVKDLVHDLRRELDTIHDKEGSITFEEADARVSAVIDQFNLLAESLQERQSESREDMTPGANLPYALETLVGDP